MCQRCPGDVLETFQRGFRDFPGFWDRDCVILLVEVVFQRIFREIWRNNCKYFYSRLALRKCVGEPYVQGKVG
jgi:hypothetical protein